MIPKEDWLTTIDLYNQIDRERFDKLASWVLPSQNIVQQSVINEQEPVPVDLPETEGLSTAEEDEIIRNGSIGE